MPVLLQGTYSGPVLLCSLSLCLFTRRRSQATRLLFTHYLTNRC